MGQPLITNVSDTARWVAAYRAMETRRSDALFRDPLAERLAGERGRAMAAQSPRLTRNGWPLITRTKLIDDLIGACVAEGCDRVLNLAAGLDTRPYRLALPAALTWIEADLPALLDEKERLLAGERPVCALTRERVDLAEEPARGAFIERAVRGSRTLVITEGLLQYLHEEVVCELGRDLARREGVRWWITDVTSPAILTMLRKEMGDKLAQAPMHFAPPNGVAFFEALGWRALEIRSMFHEAARLRRSPLLLRPFALLPAPDPRRPGRARWSAVVRLERT
jgi:methyltransferase (TIGR00027 family)